MGKVIETLAEKQANSKAIFDKRFVVELCEDFHIHYLNLRLRLSERDFVEVCKGCIDAFERWRGRGCPDSNGRHIELCRKRIAENPVNEGFKVNLNVNLYKQCEGKIFSEGANFADDRYIHLKIRDVRLEMSIAEFKELADVIGEANKRLEGSVTRSML